MKEITQNYQPVPAAFRAEVLDYLTRRKYIRIHYFNPYHEYIFTTAIIKQFCEQDGAEYIALSTGEQLRLDWIVRLDGKPAPGYCIDDFTCDC